ncbi:MAG: S9 family peptidase [Polyangiaceae bacterium]|nr:S9 family peptidase [Polyangiaceae bacterium]
MTQSPKPVPVPASPVTTASAEPAPEPVRLRYPPARRETVVDVIHGVGVADPYRWLEDEKQPEVQSWMDAEDALARAELRKLPERDAIAARLKELFYVDSLSAPVHRGSRYFYSRRHAKKEKSIVYWKEGKTGAEQVLFDPNGWSEDGSVSLAGWQASWDGTRVAYKKSQNNSDESTLYVRDVAAGADSAIDVIEGAKYASASWTPKGDGFYYTWLPTDPKIPVDERPGFAEVRFHKLGADPKQDALVHPKTGDPEVFVSGDLSRDGHWLVVTISHGWTSDEVWLRDEQKNAGRPAGGAFVPLAVGKKAHYRVEAYQDQLYVQTDEGAPRWRIFRVDPRRPDRGSWVELVPERADAAMDGFSILGGKLVVSYLRNASSLVAVYGLDGKLVRELGLPGIGSVGGPIGRQDEDEAYYSFESYTVPREIYATSIATGKVELYSKLEVPVDPSPYVVEQVFYPSKDGTKISMFVVRRKDLVKDGSARVYLYGYGGFQANETPVFMASIYPWLERGGVFAVANLRGGAEYGEKWHEDGMLLKKQNVFDDFIGAAEYLVAEQYTRPSRIAISGASNGGLLMGAALTQRPDLFGAVLCGVPLLDMVRYHKFGSGRTWASEYGTVDDPAEFRALLAYSPYHHVAPGTAYPATLFLAADHDDRVDPMHARKLAALLQADSTGGPVLLRIERHSGHGGADLVKAEVEKGADRYAFALAHTAR